MRASRFVLATSLAAVLAAPVVASAAEKPALAVGGGGAAHAAWLQSDGRSNLVQERRRAVDGTLSDAQYVSAAGRTASPPRLGADKFGTATIVWAASDGTVSTVFARRRSADGTLGVVQRVSPPGVNCHEPDVAVDADGNATYVWRYLDGASATVQVRRRAAAGSFGAIQTASLTGNVSRPRVTLDGDGDALLTWRRLAPDATTPALQARPRTAGGTLGTTQTIAASTLDDDYDVAVAPDGRAAFSWVLPQQFTYAVMGRVRAANGTLAAPQQVSPSGESSFYPTVAIDSTGRAAFGWERTGMGQHIEGRIRSAAGTLGNKFELDVGDSSRSPQVALDGDGAAVYAWTSDSFDDGMPVHARRRTAGGTLGPAQMISTPRQYALDPQLGLDAAGNAFIAWTESTGGESPEVAVRLRRRSKAGGLAPIQTLSE